MASMSRYHDKQSENSAPSPICAESVVASLASRHRAQPVLPVPRLQWVRSGGWGEGGFKPPPGATPVPVTTCSLLCAAPLTACQAAAQPPVLWDTEEDGQPCGKIERGEGGREGELGVEG